MTTPRDPQGEGRPEQDPTGSPPYDGGQQPGGYDAPQQQPGPYGQQPGPYGTPPGQYGSGQYGSGQYGPGQYAPSPYGQNPGQQPAPGQQPYAYNPYAGQTPYPAALDPSGEPPAGRPGLMLVALILMILASLPFLAVGLLLLLVPLDTSTIPAELLNDPRLVQAGATPELLISAARLFGGILLVISLLYLVFAIVAFTGRNWARILVTVLTVGFALLLLAGLIGGATDGSTLLFVVLILVFTVGGVVILFLRDSSRFFASRRR